MKAEKKKQFQNYWKIKVNRMSNSKGFVNTFRVTHSTNKDLLNIKRKGDSKSRTLSCMSDTTETRNIGNVQKVY
jgi:hypothetical protein